MKPIQKYAVIFNYGDSSTAIRDLSLVNAALKLLTNDGCEFSIEFSNGHYTLYTKRTNEAWGRTVIHASAESLEHAERAIFAEVVTKPANWWHGAEAIPEAEFGQHAGEFAADEET